MGLAVFQVGRFSFFKNAANRGSLCKLFRRGSTFVMLSSPSALVTHFVEQFSHRMGKQVESIPPETMAAFQRYSWPGDIRELQNLVERAVILSRDGILPNPLHTRQTQVMPLTQHCFSACRSSLTLEDSDRALIVKTLEQADWIVGGPRGAAAKLGLKRTTLLAKMRRLGISRPVHEDETDLSVLAPAGICRQDAHPLNDRVADWRFLP